MSGNRKKKGINIALIIIILCCVVALVILLLTKTDVVKKPKPGKGEDTIIKTASYELRKRAGDGDLYDLYIGGKIFDKIEDAFYDKNRIYELGDYIVVETCRSNCETYFVDHQGEIAGSVNNTEFFKTTPLINVRFTNYVVDSVEGDTLRIRSANYTHQDGSALCEVERDAIVEVVEEFQLNEDKTFSEAKVIEEKTVQKVLETDNHFVCE